MTFNGLERQILQMYPDVKNHKNRWKLCYWPVRAEIIFFSTFLE
jgi:hypothetical protein